MDDVASRPGFTLEQAALIAQEHFGFEGTASPLPSERDQNFRIQGATETRVLKIANPRTPLPVLELENAALQLAEAVAELQVPPLHRARSSAWLVPLRDPQGLDCVARMIGFLPGQTLASLTRRPPQLWQELGVTLARLDLALAPLQQHPAGRRELIWDLKQAAPLVQQALLEGLPGFTSGQQALLQHHLERWQVLASRLEKLPQAVIHNDANDHNVLVQTDTSGAIRIGLIDFGDLLHTSQIHELAIASAYGLLDADDPLTVLGGLAQGYHALRRLTEDELSVLFPLAMMRLCQSVCISARQQALAPENEYLGVTRAPAWETLDRLAALDPAEVHAQLSQQIRAQEEPDAETGDDLAARRAALIGPSLSLSYRRPLHLVRGRGQYLFDTNDVTYLDCVNNVCHVGHCHPDVVAAAASQMACLNTNTRYLHRHLVEYAQRLTATLPDPLQVCYLVNSGSEANDLAWRLAQAATGHRDAVVIDHAYHGHTAALIELSPYKFNGPGGAGQAQHVHVVPLPDGFRGPHRHEDPAWGQRYIAEALAVIDRAVDQGRHPAAFFAESLLGCGGQWPLPDGYLAALYARIRQAGGVCIADEVQVGLGRIGTHFWGFELQDVVPDIVTLGKPIGNGHPLAAVITTPQIAAAFDNGMEYFNTFGGNPVSCAVGLAVLDVIEREQLQSHAAEVGAHLLRGLAQLQEEHEVLGDVRGRGLFLGLEWVVDRTTRRPAPQLATEIVEAMKARRILLSTDGPEHNVIKIKPPLVFSHGDADRLLMTLGEVLRRLNR